jgi:transcriptional regulator with XRE-family HTH domain
MVDQHSGGGPKQKTKLPKLVGNFIRQRREALNISQRALGQLFTPPVTTQFISNVERGVTPFPAGHVPVLAKVLQVSEKELMSVMEQEYALRLSSKLGQTTPVEFSAFLMDLIKAYADAPADQKRALRIACKAVFAQLNTDRE